MEGLCGLQGVMGEIVGNFMLIDKSVVKKFLTTDFYIEYNRDLTNLDFTVRGWKKDGQKVIA